MIFGCEKLNALVKQYPDICVPQPSETNGLFDMLCHSIIAQQLAAKAAASISARFRGRFGMMTAETIAVAPAEKLRDLGLSRQKTGYLHSLAELALSGRINFARIVPAGDKDITDMLIQAKGIGVWTAEIFLIFGLGRKDVFPADDYGLRQAVTKLFGFEQLILPKQLREFSERWRPERSLAAMLLWASLKNT